ncbi:MAG TPA: protein kinase, partial [Ardenticatenaceae bacterium]|nr:protein kinase [Ardenticatenaceae bacterium]
MRTARTDLLDNRYRLVRRLEGGGVAEVWLAQDARLGRPVAIKRLYPQYTENREFLARLEQEARAVARLDDPRIVRIYDVVIRPNERAYLVLEYVPGRDLRAYLAEACPLPSSTALKLLREIARGVAAAH